VTTESGVFCYQFSKGKVIQWSVEVTYRAIKFGGTCNESYGTCVLTVHYGKVNIHNMQFGYRPGKGTTNAISTVRQMQEKHRNKAKKL